MLRPYRTWSCMMWPCPFVAPIASDAPGRETPKMPVAFGSSASSSRKQVRENKHFRRFTCHLRRRPRVPNFHFAIAAPSLDPPHPQKCLSPSCHLSSSQKHGVFGASHTPIVRMNTILHRLGQGAQKYHPRLLGALTKSSEILAIPWANHVLARLDSG